MRWITEKSSEKKGEPQYWRMQQQRKRDERKEHPPAGKDLVAIA